MHNTPEPSVGSPAGGEPTEGRTQVISSGCTKPKPPPSTHTHTHNITYRNLVGADSWRGKLRGAVGWWWPTARTVAVHSVTHWE